MKIGLTPIGRSVDSERFGRFPTYQPGDVYSQVSQFTVITDL